ncbi:MAG: Flp pilus assembly complex ATPase component TadA [Clostridiales bacterium]|nr:Flp pilus assembly complex ATPase component TadA [Clostridiales bacterium]
MAESGAITARTLEALLEAGLVTVEQSSTIVHTFEQEGITLGELLVQRNLVTADDLATVLEDQLGMPRVELASYTPDAEALAMLPTLRARELGMLPLFEIDGMLTVAIGDPFDIFRLDVLGEELSLEVEAVLTDPGALCEALGQYYPVEEVAPSLSAESESGQGIETPPGAEMLAPAGLDDTAEHDIEFDAADLFEAHAVDAPVAVEPSVAPSFDEVAVSEKLGSETLEEVVETETPAGSASIDLDVLAVADPAKVAVLVTEILRHAVTQGASRIHLLPYKDDFFLVYRVAGRLEKIASAPLSMQAALVEGFKSFARIGGLSARVPALNRVRTRIADRDLAVSVSSVPTIAGQRVVISFSSATESPRTLSQLGMSDAEIFALSAMVERGRGILLICAPVAGGSSSTYYALLAHAAASGRTVYSVERSVEYEIPAVAQVLVTPASPLSAAAYFSAGMRQDTDVVAIDAIHSVEDAHLAIEAAGLGKLVIATFSGGGIVAGVSRLLGMGAEPVSLAAALTLGVGQRLVRLNCQHCVLEEPGTLAQLIPGAPPGTVSSRGAGCPSCAKSGFAGATGVFEVLPITDPVRSVISRGASADEIGAAAMAVGMRPMVASGLSRVQEGLVSAAELNRVVRFTD